ncbi:DUF4126 domain-containing protein [Dyadobacter diqingensis]|uniref:DUF4126 domain-containing protein n=1 Tax=Dyadobacter diqingensis TaxID=2938121 RepID=UPI0020C18C9E|nr:DUF4126 domain-containing protein [Dyadobacter diqingensis]
MFFLDFSALAQQENDLPIGPTAVYMGVVLKLIALAAIDFYAVVFIIGLVIKFEWLDNVPTFLNPLAAGGMLLVFGVLFVVEFFVEKIPGVGAAWNGVNAFLKPIAILIFIFSVVFNVHFEIGFFTVVFGIVIVLFVGAISGKIRILLGLIPGVPIVVTLLEDAIIAFLLIKTLMPGITA